MCVLDITHTSSNCTYTRRHTHTHTLSSVNEVHAYMQIWDQDKQLARGRGQQGSKNNTFLFLPCLQVVVMEPGWHWKKKRGENCLSPWKQQGGKTHGVTTATEEKKNCSWDKKGLMTSFSTSSLNTSLIYAKVDVKNQTLTSSAPHWLWGLFKYLWRLI